MSVRNSLQTLIDETRSSLTVLQNIISYYEKFMTKPESKSHTTENAIIISEVVVSFYTCLETIFIRISQYFENSLDTSRWHKDVLHKMTIPITGIRERVISDETYQSLSELLGFRHFKRYYLAFNYDWDRLELVIKKFEKVSGPVRKEIEDYIRYLEDLVEKVE